MNINKKNNKGNFLHLIWICATIFSLWEIPSGVYMSFLLRKEENVLIKLAHNDLNIAIDGPAGAGKSTIARLVAHALGYTYIDTGAMYRAIAFHMLRAGIPPTAIGQLTQELQRIVLELKQAEEDQLSIWLNGENITVAIRTSEISRQASDYAKVDIIRKKLVQMQQNIAQRKGVVMDGRDIGTHVLPDAECKWFITASVEERARRRYMEWNEQKHASFAQCKQEIIERDKQDETRALSPLRLADDAQLLDTTTMSIEEVVDVIVKNAQLKKKLVNNY